MKKLLPFILMLILSYSAHSQGYKYTFSVGAGVTQSYADVTNSFQPQHVVHVNADYLLTDFISVGAEFQMGKLVNGIQFISPEKNLRFNSGYFENSFKELNINAKVSLGQFVKGKGNDVMDKFRGLYIGAGLGLISTSQKNINRFYASSLDGKEYNLPGSDTERMVSVPLSAGIDIYFKKKSLRPFALGINGQMNYIPNDRLDGYDTDYNNRPDVYAFSTLSLKYRFGYSSIFNSNVYPR